MKLSLSMIVKNEAHNLGKCLESVKGLADEMIVIDTGSDDATAAIAQSHGAKVDRFTWTGSFADARNFSLSLCTCEWILVLDADEMLDAKERQTIRQAIQSQEIMGYRLPIRNYLDSGSLFGPGGSAKLNDGGFEPAAACSHYIIQHSLRLFRKQKDDLYSGRIHESVEPWFEEHGHAAPPLDATIHHFGKVDLQRDLIKQPMYLALAKQEAADRPDDPIAHGNVMQEALMLEDWPTVYESAQAYLKLRGTAPPMVRLAGAKALVSMERPNEALDFIAPLAGQSEYSPAILELKAEAFQALGMFQEAIDACVQAIDSDHGYTASFIRLCWILDGLGDIETARSVLEAGLDQNTRDIRLWEALVGLASKHRDARVAQDAWHAIQAVPNGGTGLWHMIVAHVLKDLGDTQEAIRVLEMGLTAFPGNVEISELLKRMCKLQ
jgi:tetratricopeptide (TPR) repeat protein